MSKREKHILATVTVLYTLLILYFSFIGFGRLGNPSTIGYRFNLIPSVLSPNYGRFFSASLFNLGNLFAFIPFGILIPLLWKTNYFKFICVFMLSISLIEWLQMVTFLGSADIDDVILNSLGATIGYFAFFISTRIKTSVTRQCIIASGIGLILTLSLLTLIS